MGVLWFVALRLAAAACCALVPLLLLVAAGGTIPDSSGLLENGLPVVDKAGDARDWWTEEKGVGLPFSFVTCRTSYTLVYGGCGNDCGTTLAGAAAAVGSIPPLAEGVGYGSG